jgi:hypothetical protein
MLRQRIALVNRVGNHLLDLVRPEFPKVLSNDAPAYRRALLGLVARATGTMEAILHLAQLRREADLAVLIRSLCDHVTTLGWLAADPAANYPLWHAEDARERLKAHRQWQQHLRADLLTAEAVAAFEAIAAEDHPGPTDLHQRAIAADRHWKDRLGITDHNSTFAGIYQLVYRSGSTRMHSTLQGLNDVVELAPDHVVIALESTVGEQALASRALVVYGLALRISAAANGFPRAAEIDSAFAEYYGGK